ncbi:MAG: hypothetical protein KGZ72_01275 [Roseovarius sp.]|jgi:pyruvate/2-oxoacid:ferredoxin oxidoreductase alpha subunit|nr:hypothetical protein [Roseovarius sp.]
MHLIGDLYAKGYLKDYYRGKNEFAVMVAVHGASLGGGRAFTATSGPGTLRAMGNVSGLDRHPPVGCLRLYVQGCVPAPINSAGKYGKWLSTSLR